MTMSKILDYVRGEWGARHIRKGVAGLTTRLSRVEARLEKRKVVLETYQRRITALAGALAEDLEVVGSEIAEIRQAVASLEKQQKQYEAGMEALRARVKVAEDVTIPGLVAANRLVLERYDADTSIQVRRQAGNQ